ncbi:hypothetical protein ACFL17_05980 [Pseudomonadota bacterium]
MPKQFLVRFDLDRFTASVLIVSLILVSGCGESSVSSSVDAASGSTLSSAVVIDVSDATMASLMPRQADPNARRIAAVISQLMIQSAVAVTAGINIYFNAVLVGTTDTTGQVVIPTKEDSYIVCLGDGAEQVCLTSPVVVPPDSVVVISNVDVVDGSITSDIPVVEKAQDNIVLFQNADKAHKTLVCHKNRFTISVGTRAAQDGHMAHGDSLGECPSAAGSATISDRLNQNGNGKCNAKGNGNKNEECSV